MVKIGEIYYESWGYDQTNIDFCVVVEVSPTGKTALCRMMSEKTVKTEGYAPMAEEVVPDQPYGESFRLQVRQHGEEAFLVGSYPFCKGDTKKGYFSKWNGKPLYQSHYA